MFSPRGVSAASTHPVTFPCLCLAWCKTIEFYAPLTMIIGANGCGKTTVIECLKYACTGALPPGARSGQSFVHDPKVSGTNEVKANIKMRFAGRDSRMSVVIRSFQLTQRRVSLQFKALDGVIRTKDDNGASVSITHKCSDLDKNIPLRLGVSKAILENVVFCHQEDSSWPLQEGAVVKKKFDDIFESARYTKALDTIKKTKQEYAVTVKDLKIDLAELQERLRAAEELKGELEASQEDYQSFRKEMGAIDERTRELTESLEKLKAVAEQIETLQNKKWNLELACRDLGVRKKEKEENIGDNLRMDSDEVLEADLRKFDEKFNEMADEIQRLEDAASECVTRAVEAKQRKGALHGEQGSLQAQILQQERLVSERDHVMERLATRYKIFHPASSGASGGASRPEGSASRYTSEDVSSFEASLVKVVSKTEEELYETRAKACSEEEAKMSELNKAKLEDQGNAQTLRAKEEELRQLHVSVAAMTQVGGAGTLRGNSQSQMASVTLSKLERELRNAEVLYQSAKKEYEENEASNAREKTNHEIHALDTRQATLKMEIDQEEDTLRRLSAQQGEQARKAVISAEIADDESRLEERCRESSALNRSLDSPLQAVTAPALAEALGVVKMKRAETEEERASKEQDLIGLRRSVTEKETLLGQVRRELSTVDRELSGLVGAVEVVRAATREIEEEGGPSLDCTKDFQKILEFRRSQVETEKGEVIHQTHQKRFLAKQLKAARDNGHVCPTCRRGMDDEEYRAFKEVHDELMNDQKRESKIKEAKVKMNAAMEAVRVLESNAQGWREWARLSPRPAELEEEKKKIELESAALKDSLEKGRQEADDRRRAREELDQALSEAEKFVEESNRIQRNRIEVQQLEAKLLRYGSGESLEKVQERVRGLVAEKDRLVAEQQAKEKELRRLGEKQLTLTRDLTGREGDMKEAAANLEKKREFDKKREALREQERLLEAELRELKAQEMPMRLRVQEKNGEYSRLRHHASLALGRLETALRGCRTDAQDFSRLRKGVETSLARKLDEALVSVGKKLEDAEQEVTEMEQKAKVHETEMNGLIMDSQKQSQVKKILKDNIEYRRIDREIVEKKTKIGELDARIRETDKEDVRGQMATLEREKLRRTQKRAELKGRLDGMGEQIRALEVKLATDTYKHVEEKHRRKMIEHRTTEMAVMDLDKYWTALDKALLRFHTMKIADINKIIRELWAMTYSGEDIDMVEIVSGDDGEEGGGRAKRSYNYRVVMRKNDATLDMKGRCSAGQRVLASVVIRLALAETFCVSCGILALDEPTTNLDQGNKVGLARALAKIISNRSKQSNFQLIAITHDEEFKQMMSEELGIQGGFSMPEYYWRVSREELSRGKFYSRLDRYHWEDM